MKGKVLLVGLLVLAIGLSGCVETVEQAGPDPNEVLAGPPEPESPEPEPPVPKDPFERYGVEIPPFEFICHKAEWPENPSCNVLFAEKNIGSWTVNSYDSYTGAITNNPTENILCEKGYKINQNINHYYCVAGLVRQQVSIEGATQPEEELLLSFTIHLVSWENKETYSFLGEEWWLIKDAEIVSKQLTPV